MYRDYRAGLITELQYKTFNNRVDALTRRTIKEYYRNIFANYKNNTAKLWKTINNLTKPSKTKQKVSNIIYEDKILTNAKDISNAFNNFWIFGRTAHPGSPGGLFFRWGQLGGLFFRWGQLGRLFVRLAEPIVAQ